MGRPKRFPPYPRKPHSSGQARIKVDGKPEYLGIHSSPESWNEYRRMLEEWSGAPSASAIQDATTNDHRQRPSPGL